MTETLADRIKDMARQIRWQGCGDDDTQRGATFSILYDIGVEIAALTAERDGLREAHQELSRLAREVSRMYSGTSWNIGAIRRLIEYIDNQTKINQTIGEQK